MNKIQKITTYIAVVSMLLVLSCDTEKDGIEVVILNDGQVSGKLCVDNNIDGECDNEAIDFNDKTDFIHIDGCTDNECIVKFEIDNEYRNDTVLYGDLNISVVLSPLSTISILSEKNCDDLITMWNLEESACENYIKNSDKKSEIIAIYYRSFFNEMNGTTNFIKAQETVDHILSNSDETKKILLRGTGEETTATKPDSGGTVTGIVSGMSHGAGLDIINGDIHTSANCVEHEGIVKSAHLNQTMFRIDYLGDVEDLLKALMIEIKVSINMSSISAEAYFKMIDIMSKNKESLFLLMQVEVKAADFKLLKPTLAAVDRLGPLYSGEEYDKFREMCGDKFLNSITSGGRYMGLLEIKTGSAYEKLRVEAELKGKYKPMNFEIEIALQFMKEKFDKEYSYAIHVFTEGALSDSLPIPIQEDGEKPDIQYGKDDEDIETVDEETPDSDTDVAQEEFEPGYAVTMEKFLENAEIFQKTIFEKASGEDGYLYSAYQARFEPYEQIVNNIAPGETFSASNCELIKEYAELYYSYQKIIDYAEYIINNPEEFKDAKEKEREIRHFVRDVQGCKAMVALESDICRSLGDKACDVVDFKVKYDIPTEVELMTMLPEKMFRHPGTCREHRDLHKNYLRGRCLHSFSWR